MTIFADLKLQAISNYNTITKRDKIVYIIFIKQFIRKTVSNYKAILKYY